MCRLFGQRADPTLDLCEPLCSAHNALRMQSHHHPHGWGIGWYENGSPRVRRGLMPAHADAAFVRAARQAHSEIIMAHVRDASVGPVSRANTHPFVHGRWLFAHNGTVARYRRSARVRAAIEAEIDPALRRRIRGETDSERCFLLFLTRLAARCAPDAADLESVRLALAETVGVVSRIADRTTKHSSLNFLVSDGRLLAACRRRRSLYTAPALRAGHIFAVASEPIGKIRWEEVPEDGFVGVDESLRVFSGMLFEQRPAGEGRFSLTATVRTAGSGHKNRHPP